MRRLYSLTNTFRYHWRRSSWLLDPQRFIRDYRDTAIERPIFFLGDQGGGLTLIGRMIRRNPSIVSICGDSTYWSGPDEMQRVMELRLPRSLKLARLPYKVEVHHERLTAPRSWSYAADALIDYYRKTAIDYDEGDAETFRFLIREALHRFGHGRVGIRFFDKSQVYTVKLGLIHAILEDTDPYFVLLTRDPYVACYRAAQGKAIDMARYARFLTLRERVELCAQHWSNAMQCALEDGQKVQRFMSMRFENVLAQPETSLRSLCTFLDLSFDSDMLPQPYHRIPQGSRFPDRWYPLKTDINKRYLENIPTDLLAIIDARCGSLAEKLGYERPLLGVS
jgi:hypothetical protein